jgi:hypothetical protein
MHQSLCIFNFNKMRIFLVFVTLGSVFIFCNGCRNVKRPTIEKNDNVKTILIPKAIDAKNADIINDLDYLILEAKENSYFGHVSKMRVYQNRIYILDEMHAKLLLIYTIEGRHIATVGDKKGRGPLEFVSVTNFEIDYANDQLIVMDGFGYKFMIYDLDGRFVKQIDSNITVFDAVLLPNGYILHAKPSWEYKIHGQSNCQIIIVDDKKQIVRERFEYNEYKNMNIHIRDIISSQLDGGFNFAPMFRDTIYSVSFESIIPKYAIDYGSNRKIPKSTIESFSSTIDLYRFIKSSGNICFMGNHVESNDFLYLLLGSSLNPTYVFYNKQTSSTMAIYSESEITEYGYELYKILCSDSEGYFYGVFNFADVDELIGLFPELQKLDEDMNPILFRYKVKI